MSKSCGNIYRKRFCGKRLHVLSKVLTLEVGLGVGAFSPLAILVNVYCKNQGGGLHTQDRSYLRINACTGRPYGMTDRDILFLS